MTNAEPPQDTPGAILRQIAPALIPLDALRAKIMQMIGRIKQKNSILQPVHALKYFLVLAKLV